MLLTDEHSFYLLYTSQLSTRSARHPLKFEDPAHESPNAPARVTFPQTALQPSSTPHFSLFTHWTHQNTSHQILRRPLHPSLFQPDAHFPPDLSPLARQQHPSSTRQPLPQPVNPPHFSTLTVFPLMTPRPSTPIFPHAPLAVGTPAAAPPPPPPPTPAHANASFLHLDRSPPDDPSSLACQQHLQTTPDQASKHEQRVLDGDGREGEPVGSWVTVVG